MFSLNRLAFGNQGAESSRDCAFHVCTICNAKIRMSYWVVIFFVYSLLQLIQREANNPRVSGEVILWEVLRAIGDEVILLGTVLCHEFGHGNMARWLGGEIDHVLLWVFGGICFSWTPRNTDNWKLLRNDLLVVSAGPITHFLQTPLWGIILLGLFHAFSQTGYGQAYDAVLAALNPWHNFNTWTVRSQVGLWQSLPWALTADALSLNVLLFLFNVFVPMYPADGSKILVLVLMFCCGVSPRCAAWVLLCVSVPAALLFISRTFIMMPASGGAHMMSGVMLWMGIMSLCEAYKIWQLLSQRRIHEHPLFQTARSWRREERDSFGRLNRINNSGFDDEESLPGTGTTCCVRDMCEILCGPCGPGDTKEANLPCPSLCRSGCCCPCLGQREGKGLSFEGEVDYGSAQKSAANSGVRAERGSFLARMEQQSMDRQRTVRDLQDDRYAQQK